MLLTICNLMLKSHFTIKTNCMWDLHMVSRATCYVASGERAPSTEVKTYLANGVMTVRFLLYSQMNNHVSHHSRALSSKEWQLSIHGGRKYKLICSPSENWQLPHFPKKHHEVMKNTQPWGQEMRGTTNPKKPQTRYLSLELWLFNR